MTRGDTLVEKGAERLQALSRRAAQAGGARGKLAPTLAEDAAFLRKLKPSLIAKRARGQAPTDQEPPAGDGAGPSRRRKKAGVSPLAVVGAAFVVGAVLAKLIDWRGHAHPGD